MSALDDEMEDLDESEDEEEVGQTTSKLSFFYLDENTRIPRKIIKSFYV